MAHDNHIEIGLIPGSNNAGIFFFVLGVHLLLRYDKTC